jgi:sigma-B regulation protein RsbU (phosphoserine phosphatase)
MDLDLSIASGIQQMLLPRSPRAIAGLDLDARYIPAQKVGGDLYDIIPLSERRLGVAVADVSGKGIPASLLMAIARTNLRQIALRYQSPARVLVELNRAIAEDMHAGVYVTMLYAVIDVERGTLTFARAGHELPLVGRHDPATGSFHPRFIGSDGMPVGMVGDELFSAVLSDHTDVFLPGHVLVLYTDGVTEAQNEDQREFSAARLADAVRALHTREAKAINDGILEAVQRFTGDAPQYDDITLVTIKRL